MGIDGLVKRRRRVYSVWESDLRTALRQARSAASERREVCGVLLDVGPCLRLVQTKNVSRHEGTFSISGADLRRIDRHAVALGHEVVGIYHSHILASAVPGPADLEHAPPRSLMLILQALDRTASMYWVTQKRAQSQRFKTVRSGVEGSLEEGRP